MAGLSRRSLLLAPLAAFVAAQRLGATAARPLPPLPLSAGAKVAGFGHSFIGRGSYSRYKLEQLSTFGLQGDDRTALGYLWYVQALDRRFNLDSFADADVPRRPAVDKDAVTGAQQGLSADHLGLTRTVPGTISRTPYLVSLGPDIVVLDIGTNDIASGVNGTGGSSAAEIIAAFDRQLSLLAAAGIWVVTKTIAWRFDFPAGDARLALIGVVNDWLQAQVQARRPGFRLLDTVDLDGTAAVPQGTGDAAIICDDGVHPSVHGAREIARRLLPLLQAMVAPAAAVATPAGADIFPHRGLPGTGGSKGAGVTGQVATGLVIAREIGNSTAVAGKRPRAGLGEAQLLKITPVADGTPLHQFRIHSAADILFADLQLGPGDWLQIEVPVTLDDWEGWRWYSRSVTGCPLLQYNEQYAGPGMFVWETNLFGGLPGATFVLRSKLPILAMARADRLRWSVRPLVIQFRSDAGGSGTVEIGAPAFRKITDPRRAWNLPRGAL